MVLEVLRLEMWLDTKPCQPLQVLVALRASGRHHSKFWWHSEHLADTFCVQVTMSVYGEYVPCSGEFPQSVTLDLHSLVTGVTVW